MAREVVVYLVVHQPRRLRLSAQPIAVRASAEEIERVLFDEPLNERYFRKVARRCYRPATELFAELAEQGLKTERRVLVLVPAPGPDVGPAATSRFTGNSSSVPASS